MNRAISSKLAGLGVVALAAASGTAQAEVSSTITIATDYDFRGVTQNGLDPAFQASLDWAGESGLYAGLWGSNIDFGQDGYAGFDGGEGGESIDPIDPVDLNVEVDLYLGYAGSFTEDFGYDVGAVYYKYLGDDDGGINDFDYAETYAGVSWKILSTKVWYAWDYGNSGDSAWYVEANADIPLPMEFGLELHTGYSGGDYWDTEEYYDYSVGIIRSLGRFDFAVKYIDGSDLKSADCSRSEVSCVNDVFSSESKAFASISTTFPWSDE